MPNLQHQNLRREKTPNLQQNLREEKKHQIYIKIYVRNREKKYAKFTISIFT